MPDWDENSPLLQANLTEVLRGARDAMRARAPLESSYIRKCHKDMMAGLMTNPLDAQGVFRVEPGLDRQPAYVGKHEGAAPHDVAAHLQEFDQKLGAAMALVDARIAPGAVPDAAQLRDVLQLCAWAHGDWVRIHPFANGNGRTAHLIVNMIAMRYGLPPFVALRPRPADLG